MEERELPPVGGGDPVAVRLAARGGPDLLGLPTHSYRCAVDKDTDLAVLADALTAELQGSGVLCSGVVLRADSRRLAGDLRRLEADGHVVLPRGTRRRKGHPLEIAFSVEGHCKRAAAGAPQPTSLSAEETSWKLLPRRYTLGEELGRGAYGKVLEARDAVSDTIVAVKRVECSFDNLVYAKRLLREVKILRQVDSAHLVKLRDVCLPGGETASSFHQLFLVFDKCDGDLQGMISRGPALEEARVAQLLQDILGGVAYLHSLSILHRDLKPANCLLKDDRVPARVLLCDLGLSRSAPAAVPDVDELGPPPPPVELVRQISEHMVTRWYRPPELLLSEHYGEPVDVWAVGCMLGELLQLVPSGGGSEPLFRGAQSDQSPGARSFDPAGDMLAVVLRVLGPAGSGELARARAGRIADAERASARSPGTPLGELLPNATSTALVLLRGLLAFEPKARPTARQALRHGLLAGLEPVSVPEAPLPPPEASGDFDVADEDLKDAWRRAELSRELRERFREELDARCGPR